RPHCADAAFAKFRDDPGDLRVRANEDSDITLFDVAVGQLRRTLQKVFNSRGNGFTHPRVRGSSSAGCRGRYPEFAAADVAQVFTLWRDAQHNFVLLLVGEDRAEESIRQFESRFGRAPGRAEVLRSGL